MPHTYEQHVGWLLWRRGLVAMDSMWVGCYGQHVGWLLCTHVLDAMHARVDRYVHVLAAMHAWVGCYE